MESLLPRCLDSFVINMKQMCQTEIIIVNDGSRDGSSAIAHSYENKYPGIYKVIDKSNGNYGSCINAALKVATGKYFRICDADDCYISANLEAYIDFLSSVDVDIVFSPYETYCGDTLKSSFEVLDVLRERVFMIDELRWDSPELFNFRAMHSMATKREILVTNKYYQTEGISYTDTQFIFYSMLYAKNCCFYKDAIYVYYLGRGGQTMSPISLINSHMHFYENAKRMLIDYIEVESFISRNKSTLLEMSIASCLGFYISVVLCYLSNQRSKIKLFKELLDMLSKTKRASGFNKLLNKSTPYKLWHRYHVPAMVIRAMYKCKTLLVSSNN